MGHKPAPVTVTTAPGKPAVAALKLVDINDKAVFLTIHAGGTTPADALTRLEAAVSASIREARNALESAR